VAGGGLVFSCGDLLTGEEQNGGGERYGVGAQGEESM